MHHKILLVSKHGGSSKHERTVEWRGSSKDMDSAGLTFEAKE